MAQTERKEVKMNYTSESQMNAYAASAANSVLSGPVETAIDQQTKMLIDALHRIRAATVKTRQAGDKLFGCQPETCSDVCGYAGEQTQAVLIAEMHQELASLEHQVGRL